MKHEDSPTEVNGKLFPTDFPASEWVEFQAAGFSKPVCRAIYRFDQPATSGYGRKNMRENSQTGGIRDKLNWRAVCIQKCPHGSGRGQR